MRDRQTTFIPFDSFPHLLQKGVMPIVAKRDDEIYPTGTGFIVGADGLMITASHVLKYSVTCFGGQYKEGKSNKIDSELYAIYVSDVANPENLNQLLGGLLPIDKVWIQDGDIGLCWLRLPFLDNQKLKLPVVRLSPGLPKQGDKIIGVGYHAMDASWKGPRGDLVANLNYFQKTAISTGHVLDVHPIRRDQGFLSFPCFRVSARFEHGMSGGPVFNEAGNVCGVITSGSSFSEDSYAALIWIMFGYKIECIVPPDESLRWITLYELAKGGHIATDESFELINVSQTNAGLVIGMKKLD